MKLTYGFMKKVDFSTVQVYVENVEMSWISDIQDKCLRALSSMDKALRSTT
jgi:hypothetical protein